MVSLDDKKYQKRNEEAAMDVQIRLLRDTVRSEIREVKLDIMKKVDDKFEQIINLIKKKYFLYIFYCFVLFIYIYLYHCKLFSCNVFIYKLF